MVALPPINMSVIANNMPSVTDVVNTPLVDKVGFGVGFCMGWAIGDITHKAFSVFANCLVHKRGDQGMNLKGKIMSKITAAGLSYVAIASAMTILVPASTGAIAAMQFGGVIGALIKG